MVNKSVLLALQNVTIVKMLQSVDHAKRVTISQQQTPLVKNAMKSVKLVVLELSVIRAKLGII